MKVFLLDPKSYIGKSVNQRLVEAGHEVVTSNERGAELGATILQCDAIVIDINNREETDEEITGIITFLKDTQLEQDLILVAISTVMTWNQTGKSSKKMLKESNYKSRKCSVRYKHTRILETLVLSSQKPSLFTYVIAPGILYGNGEHDLHKLFEYGWLCEMPSLPYIGEGKNIVPMIHVLDMSTIVRCVLEAPPAEQQYIVAVDNSTTTQKALVQAISTGLSHGQTHSIDKLDESILSSSLYGVVNSTTSRTISNTTSTPTTTSNSNSNGNSEIYLSDMRFEIEYVPSLDMEWISDTGICVNFDTIIRYEYIRVRNLRPLRIYIHGAPASGKTMYAEKLSRIYYLPHIKIADVIMEAMNRHDEMSEKISAALAESAAHIRSSKTSGKKSTSSKLKNSTSSTSTSSSSGSKKGGQGRNELDLDVPRLPVSLVTELFKIKLRSPECRNKGFILDGYPRTLEEATLLFGLTGETDEDDNGNNNNKNSSSSSGDGDNEDENDAPERRVRRDPSTMVDFVISLSITEDAAMNRLKALSEADIILNHNDEIGFKRRWQRYMFINDLNAETLTNPLLFLNEVEVLEMAESLNMDINRCMSAMSVYVERKGKPANYHPTPEEVEIVRKENEEKQRKLVEKTDREKRERDLAEIRERERRGKAEDARRAQVMLEDAELVEAASQPLRSYLMANVIPALVDGLLDVCRVQPEDPVDYLAEYLFKYSVGQIDSNNAFKQEQEAKTAD